MIKVSYPTKAQILSGGFQIACAIGDKKWNKSQLGEYADSKGVYVHHCNGAILYVGQTTLGELATFAERLRREFRPRPDTKHWDALQSLLASQKHPIHSYLLDYQDLDVLVDSGPISIKPEAKAMIMEQILIAVYNPPGNRRQNK